MSSRRRTTGWRVPPFLGLSILSHIVILAIVAGTSLGRGCNPEASLLALEPTDHGPIDLTMIEPTVLNPYATRPTEAEQKAEVEKKVEEAKKPEADRDLHGQIVDNSKPAVEIRPDQAKYLSQYDSKVEHETKAPSSREPGTGQPKRVASIAVPPQHAQPRVEEIAPKAPTHGEHGEGKLAMRSAQPIEHPPEEPGKEDGLVKAEAGTEAPRGAAEPGDNHRGGKPGEEQKGVEGQAFQPAMPDVAPRENLRLSDQSLARVISSGGSDDYLKDVDDGAETLLNSKRTLYWTFFERVKRGVAHEWRPDMAYRLRDPTGQIYGFKNRYTVLKVSLNPDGSLMHVSIERPSGVDFLDDEAVTAMKTAQPFPNPPTGLVDPESHLITFRFGFMFEIGGPRLRVYRQ